MVAKIYRVQLALLRLVEKKNCAQPAIKLLEGNKLSMSGDKLNVVANTMSFSRDSNYEFIRHSSSRDSSTCQSQVADWFVVFAKNLAGSSLPVTCRHI